MRNNCREEAAALLRARSGVGKMYADYALWVANWSLLGLMVWVMWDKFGGTIRW